MKKRLLLICLCINAILVLAHAQSQSQRPAPQLGERKLKDVMAAMTLQEKAVLVVGMGFKMPGVPPPAQGEKPKPIDIAGYTFPATDPGAYAIPEKVTGAAGRTHAIPRLGIPSITFSDGPAGVKIDPTRPGDKNTYYATAFPIATLLASTWDTALVKKVGEAFGNEVREYGVDILLGPALNIHRNPLGGRNFEYYSEDPLVSGSMTAAMVEGIQSAGVGTAIKHFAANNQETNRMQVNTIVSARALREIYLKGFEIAVKRSAPWVVMSSYNKINGTYTSESRPLLTGILKGEWGFKGFVMTDFLGGRDAVTQMNAGNDWLLPGYPDQSDSIVAAVQDGRLSIGQLDENVARILKIVLKTPAFKGYKYSNKPDLKGHATISRRSAAQGMVLLKNETATLPLVTGKRIALFGNASYHTIAGGTGSGDVNKAYIVSIWEGLSAAGFKARQTLAKSYTAYLADAMARQPQGLPPFVALPLIGEMDVASAVIEREADTADIAIITIGRRSGEWADRKVENDFHLTDTEAGLIAGISNAFHAKGKKVVVVLNIGGVIEVASWRDKVDAILLAWQPGQEAGNAVADIVSGKVDPSGKLATTFPLDYNDVPSAKNFPGKDLPLLPGQMANPITGRPAEVNYQEDIYVGYRYYDSFKITPAYEFGYGLSYTRFAIGNVKTSTSFSKNGFVVHVTITNTGKVAGKEVVQLYLSAPNQTLAKPEQELKGFVKTQLLLPGESQSVTFTLNASDLASFHTDRSAWIADAGDYKVNIGTSSRAITRTVSFHVPEEIVIKNLLFNY